jgi:NADH-quinone oxidoreductase subunit E
VACMRDLNIEVLTMTDLMELEGEAGNFRAIVRTRPRSVNKNKCTGCGDCIEHCPVRNVPKPVEAFKPSRDIDNKEKAMLDDLMAKHQGDPGALMPMLEAINRNYGHLPRQLIEHTAERLNIPMANVLRVASFYDKMRFKPSGRHLIQICNGTSCHSQHSKILLHRLEKELGVSEGQTDQSGRFTLTTVRCLGLCALSPSIRIDDVTFSRVEPHEIPSLLEQFA